MLNLDMLNETERALAQKLIEAVGTGDDDAPSPVDENDIARAAGRLFILASALPGDDAVKEALRRASTMAARWRTQFGRPLELAVFKMANALKAALAVMDELKIKTSIPIVLYPSEIHPQKGPFKGKATRVRFRLGGRKKRLTAQRGLAGVIRLFT